MVHMYSAEYTIVKNFGAILLNAGSVFLQVSQVWLS